MLLFFFVRMSQQNVEIPTSIENISFYVANRRHFWWFSCQFCQDNGQKRGITGSRLLSFFSICTLRAGGLGPGTVPFLKGDSRGEGVRQVIFWSDLFSAPWFLWILCKRFAEMFLLFVQPPFPSKYMDRYETHQFRCQVERKVYSRHI